MQVQIALHLYAQPMVYDLPHRQDYVHGCICADRLSLYYMRASLYVPTVL